MTTQAHTHLKPQEAITELTRTATLHPPYCPDLAPSDFHLFGALKDAIFGKLFESDDKITDKQTSGCKYKIHIGTRRGQRLFFRTGARLLKLMEIMKKHEACNTSNSLSYKYVHKLYNKLPAIKKLCRGTFWATLIHQEMRSHRKQRMTLK